MTIDADVSVVPVRSSWGRIVWNAALKSLLTTIIAFVGTIALYVWDIRHWGSDLSQSLYVQFPGGALGIPEERGPAIAERWALVDIGPRFCQSQYRGRPSCPPDAARTDPRSLAGLIAWVAAAGPRLIVVDIEGVQTGEELRYLEAVLKKVQRRVPVFMPIPYESPGYAPGKREPTVVPDERAAKLLGKAGGGGSIGFYSSQIVAPAPVARLLLTRVRIAGRTDMSEVDTLAFAAALALDSPQPAHESNASPVRTEGAAGSCKVHGSDLCRQRFHETERVFSFRPITPADDAYAVVEAQVQRAPNFQYLYLPAPQADVMNRVSPTTELADAVVLIGDTRSTGEDRPWTAIGAVSGAEVHLNDIRQFSMMHPAPDALGGYLLSEAPLLGAGFLAIAVVEVWLARRRGQRPRVPKRSFRYPLSTLWSLLLIALALAFVAAIFLQLHHFEGRVPDIITPFVALLLFTAAELFFRLILWAEARFAPEH